ncbi:60S ribosomal protein L18a-like isoform X5 [Camellia sinensis]|nr:60S ribosomal protein L18a-like isoform X5 [Camellia sinensis]
METDQHPKIYRMKLWATNEVRAKSKFWYFLRKLKKVKKSNGQMLAINEAYVYLSHRVLDEIRVDVASQLSAGIQRKNSWKEDRGC